jgi:CubicO group peptidase (beta-lactamase class C family)
MPGIYYLCLSAVHFHNPLYLKFMKKIIFLLLAFPLALHAQKNYDKLLDAYMTAETGLRDFNGVVMVVQKDKTLYRKAFGLADMEWNVPNTVDTKFRIGSVTKQFTAACILQLEEQGKLSVNDKLNKYIPDYPKGDSITIHMLLNHSSGIKNYTSLPEFWPKAILPLSKDSMIALFKNKPLDFPPGSKFSYSNSGYFLLGVIVEKASGKAFNDYLLENVIRKAGLPNTGMDHLDSVLAFRAKGYAKKRTGGWAHADYIAMEGPYSAGAMYSTLDDLVKWTKALHNNQIISAESRKKMMTPYYDNYGYGIGIDSFKTHPRVSHNGGIPGFSSSLAYYPKDDAYVVAISNTGSNADKISASLSAIIFDFPVTPPYNPKEIKIDPAILDKYTGKYMATNPIELVKRDNKLYRKVERGPEIELKPESTTRFFYADASDRFIEFEVDKSGNPVKAWFMTVNERIEMRKL